MTPSLCAIFWLAPVGPWCSPGDSSGHFVEVAQQGIEAFVGRVDDSIGVGIRLDNPAKLKGDVEVLCVLASALDLLEIESLETLSRGLL